jgi:hypothetical protein
LKIWQREEFSVSRPVVFICCGELTDEEKTIGKHIAEIVSSNGFEPFFAEDVHDLNGLDDNILRALHDCAAFVTVLHPRGQIRRPDNSVVTRASVWIEQEIAIAAYIQRVEKRALPVIAFAHKDVSLEGLRTLLHINPIPFSKEADIIFRLPEHLLKLKPANPSIELRMESVAIRRQDNHPIRILDLKIHNDTSQRFTEFNGKLWIPREFLNHRQAVYPTEDRSTPNAPRRCFKFSEEGRGVLNPHDFVLAFSLEYCSGCASIAHGGIAASVGEAEFEAKAWLNNQEYSVRKSVTQLGKEAEA